jgi:hypothetical protein
MNTQKPIPKSDFDLNDVSNLGRPIYWDLNVHLLAIEQMIRADEIQIALQMIDQVPAWYRENRPAEIEQIRKTIYRQHYDIFLYGNDPDEAAQNEAICKEQWFGNYCYPRAEIITAEIKRLNDELRTPWIFDLSCSHGNLGVGLRDAGLKFNYLGKSMNWRAADKLKGWMGAAWADQPQDDQTTILVCTEALEHAWDPGDIVRAAYKTWANYDQIFFSTPLGCLGGGLPNWETRPLGHIRGYTPDEFLKFAIENFPGYSWKLYKSASMVLHGRRG